MSYNSKVFAGRKCGTSYERENQEDYLDRILFYIDGRMKFERYCHGEAAGIVLEVWSDGLDAEGKVLWSEEPMFPSHKEALPYKLTDVQEEGRALQFDYKNRRFIKIADFKTDPANDYTLFKVLKLRKKLL